MESFVTQEPEDDDDFEEDPDELAELIEETRERDEARGRRGDQAGQPVHDFEYDEFQRNVAEEAAAIDEKYQDHDFDEDVR